MRISSRFLASLVVSGIIASVAASATNAAPAKLRAQNNTVTYLVTYAARSCPSYTDVTANLARNNIMESLEDLGANTLYSSGQAITPQIEDRGQPNCVPLTGWRFKLGTGIGRHDTGTFGRLSRVTSPYSTSITTKSSTPERNPAGNATGRAIHGAVTVELTAEQAQRAQQGSSLWVQGGIPGDPVLNGTFPNQYGFAALRCAVDNLNGDNVEWIGFRGGNRHAFCYAYYVKPPPTAGTIIVTKTAKAYEGASADTAVQFPFKGSISYEVGGRFTIATKPGSSASTSFTRGETGSGEPWTVQEDPIDGWRLDSLVCSSDKGGSEITTSGALASIRLAGRDTVRCTYTNSPIATTSLVVAKRTQGHVGAFPITVTPHTALAQPTFRQTLTTTEENIPKAVATGFTEPGRYDIKETLPDSEYGTWRLVSASCNGVKQKLKSGVLSVTLTAGQPAPTCELVNEFVPKGSIELWGVAWGANTTKAFHIERIGTPADPFEAIQRVKLKDAVPGKASGDDTSTLSLGTYVITEFEPVSRVGDWTLVDVTCTSGAIVSKVTGGVRVRLTRSIPDVQCAFTNRLDPDPSLPGPGPGPDPEIPPAQPDPDPPTPERPGDSHGTGQGHPTDGSGPNPTAVLPAGTIETGSRNIFSNPLQPWTMDDELLQGEPVVRTRARRARRSGPQVIIPRLGIRTRPYALTTTRANQLRVPARIDKSGWWGGGSSPGAAGLSVVVGHVDGPAGPGVFNGLHRTRRGDVIKVRRLGRTVTYRVTSVRSVRKRRLAPRQLFGTSRVTRKPMLRLITCGGTFSTRTNSYAENVIVEAVAR